MARARSLGYQLIRVIERQQLPFATIFTGGLLIGIAILAPQAGFIARTRLQIVVPQVPIRTEPAPLKPPAIRCQGGPGNQALTSIINDPEFRRRVAVRIYSTEPIARAVAMVPGQDRLEVTAASRAPDLALAAVNAAVYEALVIEQESRTGGRRQSEEHWSRLKSQAKHLSGSEAIATRRELEEYRSFLVGMEGYFKTPHLRMTETSAIIARSPLDAGTFTLLLVAACLLAMAVCWCCDRLRVGGSRNADTSDRTSRVRT
jgi:hypothetical protein